MPAAASHAPRLCDRHHLRPPLEADAVKALFDRHWDDEPCGEPYDKAENDPNAYSTGTIGRHNVVLASPPGMGKVTASAVAATCRMSFPNVRLALVVGICGAVPFPSGLDKEVILGDVIISSGIVQYDFGRRLPEGFARKDTLLDSLGRPNIEIRSLLAKLRQLHPRRTLQGRMARYLDRIRKDAELATKYPGAAQDRLFEASYRHLTDGVSCDVCGCNGKLVPRSRLENGSLEPAVHLGLVASGDTVMMSGVDRDAIAQQENIVCFDMEGAGVWDCFPCVVIKGACDYADSHKTKAWQHYAAATAAACMKAFLDDWVPSQSPNAGAAYLSDEDRTVC
ncbi:hypothetical protein IMZ48_39865 [Candidatus Bathyarchaeota archaeon]|nr:hypothetical protein [Candidatus Bathyarchaeota archaeon]